jgi:hypothetical protein
MLNGHRMAYKQRTAAGHMAITLSAALEGIESIPPLGAKVSGGYEGRQGNIISLDRIRYHQVQMHPPLWQFP